MKQLSSTGVSVPRHPLPTTEVVCEVNLAQAYQQLQVTPAGAGILIINAINRLYKVKQLPFGVSAAPAIFQRFVEMMCGLAGVCAYLDDIIISGATKAEHNDRLAAVLQRQVLQRQSSTNKVKSRFAVQEYIFWATELMPKGFTKRMTRSAIVEAPAPTI